MNKRLKIFLLIFIGFNIFLTVVSLPGIKNIYLSISSLINGALHFSLLLLYITLLPGLFYALFKKSTNQIIKAITVFTSLFIPYCAVGLFWFLAACHYNVDVSIGIFAFNCFFVMTMIIFTSYAFACYCLEIFPSWLVYFYVINPVFISLITVMMSMAGSINQQTLLGFSILSLLIGVVLSYLAVKLVYCEYRSY